jgi:hypothetical protein
LEIVSIDVEGWDLEVLRGFSLERYRPSVLIIENVLDEAAYHQALGARGYKRWTHVPRTTSTFQHDVRRTLGHGGRPGLTSAMTAYGRNMKR